jgi:lysophospholipase L1-like esterase
LAESIDPSINTAFKSAPKLENDGYFWFKRHEAILELQKLRQPDFVLIGDSITHRWGGEPTKENEPGKKSPPDSAAWKEIWDHHNVINMGFGWDRTQNVLWRLQHGEMEGIQPKVIVLNIGTNNLTPTEHSRANTPEEVSAAHVTIVEILRQRCPKSRIIVMGIFPRHEAPPTLTMKNIDQTNELTARSLAGKPGIQFLDLRNKLLEPDGTLSKQTFPDGTHPSADGYRIWGRALIDAGIFR